MLAASNQAGQWDTLPASCSQSMLLEFRVVIKQAALLPASNQDRGVEDAVTAVQTY